MPPLPPSSTLFPYTTLFRSAPGNAMRGQRGRDDRSAGDRQCRREVCTEVTAKLLIDGVLAERNEGTAPPLDVMRSEEHTSELQSRQYLVCRLLLEKKKKQKN